jgi:hypothetical protein
MLSLLMSLKPVFGKFVNDAKTIAPTGEDYATAHELVQSMLTFHTSEGYRHKTICHILRVYDIAIQPGLIGASESKTDGHICTTTCPKFILEIKNKRK